MDDVVSSQSDKSSRTAADVLTLWRGCYDDARLIDTPWAGNDGRALALVHALDFSTGDSRGSRRRRRHAKKDDTHSGDDDDRDSQGDDGHYDDDDDDDDEQGVTLNGLAVRSPLAAATGTYTAERAADGGRRPWVHFYRACVPDLPGTSGRRSSAQVYVKALEAAGLDVAASASLFTGLGWSVGRGVQAQVRVVTHQNVGLDPIEFARRTLVALGAAERAVRRRAARTIAAADAVTDAIDHEIDRLRDRLLTAYERAPRHAAVSRQPSHQRESSAGSGRHRRRRRTRDDGTERVWCPSHERWERVDVSCVDDSAKGGSSRAREITVGDASSSLSSTSSASSSTSDAQTKSDTTRTSHGGGASTMPTAFEIPERSDDAYSCCSECCSSSGCSCSMETSTRETSTTGGD